jgi:hypothetical protein
MRTTLFVLQNVLCGLVLILAGAALLLLPQYPELGTAVGAWIEGQGIALNLGVAILLLAGGLWLLSTSTRLVTTQTITYTKGTLRTSLGKDLLNQTVQQLWQEYFLRSDLSVSVALRRHSLAIFGQVPEKWNKHADLTAFVSNRLLSLTGYWGEIHLYTSEHQAPSEPV